MTKAFFAFFVFSAVLPGAVASTPKQELDNGLKAAEAYNWAAAAPHFRAAELHLSGRDRVLAKIGYWRSTMEQRNLAELTRQYQGLTSDAFVRSDAKVRMWLYIAKGDCDNDLQFPEAAKRDWRLVQELAASIRNMKWIYRAKGEAAIPAYYLGDLASSRRLVTEALGAATAANDFPSVVRLLTHIGTVYMLRGDFAKGNEHLQKAEALSNKAPESGYPVNVKEGQLLGLIGTGQLDAALALANNIVTRMQAEQRRINEAQTRVMLAGVLEKQQKVPDAIRQLNTAIAISREGSYYHSLSEAQTALAKLYLRGGNVAQAARYVTASIDSMGQSGIVSNRPSQLFLLASLREQQKRFSEANAIYKRAEDEIDSQLALTPASSKQLVLKSTSEIYAKHFAMLADHTQSQMAEYATVERIRGRGLTDLLTSRSFASAQNGEDGDQEVSALRLRLASAKTPADAERTREEIFFARHKRWLDKEKNKAASVSADTEMVLPLATVKKGLKSTELLIEYVVDARSVYALTITTTSARVVRLGSTEILNNRVSKFNDAIRAKREALEEGSALYDLILKPIPEITDHSDLVIVPDGMLHSVAFAALVHDGKRVVFTHSIVRAPSASSYVLLQRRSAGGEHKGLLAVGGVRYSPDTSKIAASRGFGEKLSNLPGSEEEAEAATESLSPKLGAGLFLSGDSATETAVKDALGSERDVIHLAVHGLANSKEDPELAALVFLPDPSRSQDGLLETSEIVRLRLHSDLVVLSACETAVGEVQGEEGVANLSRSFLLAGAETVVSTLWAVDDAFSATLMKHFYDELAGGSSKAAALEKAQRYVVDHFPGTAAPWYWAGYLVEGNAAAPLSKLVNRR